MADVADKYNRIEEKWGQSSRIFMSFDDFEEIESRKRRGYRLYSDGEPIIEVYEPVFIDDTVVRSGTVEFLQGANQTHTTVRPQQKR